MNSDRRNVKRRKCNYYLKMLDYDTQSLVGYFADFSAQGFKADLPRPIAVEQNYKLRVDLTGDVSDKAYIELIAHSCWQRPDATEPSMFNAGFQIVGISAQDNRIYQRVVEQYGLDSAW